ncbi:MAG: amino acid adenylation domain-containing protein, partial [Verrucomicrobia bacterium]
FAGTFVRHPLAMAAAHASLQWLKARGHTPQETANALTGELADRVNAAFARRGIDAHLAHFSSFFHLHFAEEPPHAGLLFYHLRHRGIHIWEGRVGFLSVAHTPEDVDRIAGAFEESIDAMAGVGLLRAARPTPPQDDRGGSPASGESPRSVPLTDAQRELFLAASFGREANAALNISMTIRLRGDADHGALRSAITDVVHRHESLRCTFAPDGSTQTIHPPGPVDILEAPHAPGTAEFAAWVREVCSTPFDLEKGPVFRFWIASSGHETQVIFIAHHIACDGWSCDTLIRDLAACYNARTAGREPSLPPAESLTAWALGEAERRTSKARKDALAFWRERLADPPPPPPLPEDFPRPRRPSYRGETIHRKLTAEVRSRLESLVASARATPFGLLYTTFSILIHRLSGATDLLIGIPVAGQNVYRKHSLVAHCVKYLPTRVRIDPSLSFRELVNRTQVELFKQIAHAHVSLGDLTRELRWRPDPSRPSSVGLAFNLDPALADIAFDGLEFSAFQNHSEYFNAELAFNAILGPDEIVLEASYNTDIFAGQTVYNWLAAFETLLCDCIQSPDTPIGDLAFTVDRCDAASTPAPVEAEQEALLLHQLFEHQASQTPEAIAVVDGDTRLSYDALDVRANRLAHLLVERGAAADERVALFFERSADFVIALLAVLKSGAAVVPIDPSWPAERQRQVLATADPLIAIAPTVDAFPDALPEKVHLVSFAEDAPDIAARPTTAPAIATRPEHLAYVLFTSGSTGEPKGVMIEHRAVVAHIPSIARVYGIGAEDVSLLFHSVAFDPTIEQIFCALTCGGRLVIRGPELWTPAEFAAVVAREKLTVIDLPPSYCVQLLQGWLDDSPVRGALDSLRLIILGGEPMPPRAIELWRALGLRRTRLINSYGPTEATITATTWEVPFDAEAFPTEAEAIPIGRPHGPVGVHVIDDQGQPVPAGGIGELCLSGPTLARGYLGHPEVTAARFAPAPFDPGLRIYRTGDRVRLRPDGL